MSASRTSRVRRSAQSLAAALLVTATLLLAAGCHPYPCVPFGPRLDDRPVLGRMQDDHAVIELLVATDRRETQRSDPRFRFSGERSRGLSFATAEVTIPPYHCRGRLEAPPLRLRAGDPARHIVLQDVRSFPRPDFVHALRTRLRQLDQAGQRRQVLVVVPGYAVTFSDALRRTAQIAHDAEFAGVPIAYTWSTQGGLLSYLVDASNAEWTIPYFVAFLELLTDELGDDGDIHILAHSMGARVVCDGVLMFMLRQQDPDGADTGPPPLSQVILAAADIDAEIFARDYVPPLKCAAARVSIYVSANDWALIGSRRLHKYTRLGEASPLTTRPADRARFDVIDATACDRGIVGHVYYGSSPTVLADLAGILADVPASDRALEPVARAYRIHPRINALRGD
jgi:esterase/lipase superfamily enzyme